MSLSLIFSYLALFHCKFLHFSFFFLFLFLLRVVPHMGLHVPFALTLLAYAYPFFCLFPCICIHFELVDVPNKAGADSLCSLLTVFPTCAQLCGTVSSSEHDHLTLYVRDDTVSFLR